MAIEIKNLNIRIKVGSPSDEDAQSSEQPALDRRELIDLVETMNKEKEER